jgi:hypothetical protein
MPVVSASKRLPTDGVLRIVTPPYRHNRQGLTALQSQAASIVNAGGAQQFGRRSKPQFNELWTAMNQVIAFQNAWSFPEDGLCVHDSFEKRRFRPPQSKWSRV